MVRLLIPFLLALATLGSLAQAGVHLTPRISEYDLDGVKIKHLVFEAALEPEITYSPPAGWNYFGEAAKLTLRPPNKLQAEATVTVFPLAQPAPFDDATLTRLRDEALASAPEGSTNVTLISEEKNPVRIGNKETLLVICSYVFYGEHYSRSLMCLNRANEQVRFQLVCRSSDFKELQQVFLRSHLTWQNL